MRDDLLLYYERELSFLRQMGSEFAERYPKIAARLGLETEKCEDPHVERLIEAFAFLAARVHLKIDDEFPEITEAMLHILYPHYLRPVPSMTVVQFYLDHERGGVTTPQHIKRESMLNSRPVQGVPCQFWTAYETTVWPVNIDECEWKTPDRLNPAIRSSEAVGAIRVEMKAPQGASFQQLGMKNLRFFINAESNLAHTIYELIFSNCIQVVVRDPGNTRTPAVILRPDECIRPVGFRPEESMLPYPRRSFDGYRLLQEYFAFPEKFLFFELSGLEAAWQKGIKDRAEIIFLFSQFEFSERRQNLELGVNNKTLRLNCTPVINLFRQTAEPILLDQRRYEYPVVPDIRRPMATEVFSIEDVVSIDTQTQEVLRFDPFYSYRHTTLREKRQTFWLTHRRASQRKNDDGTDVYISMVDLSTRPVRPKTDVLTVRTLSTNRDLPSKLPFGSDQGDFELEGAATVKRIVALQKPTPTVRPPMGKDAFWRLISHLSLNYLSLTDDTHTSAAVHAATSAQGSPSVTTPDTSLTQGRDAFKEILKLYNYSGSVYMEKQINGILKMHGTRQFARVFSENGIAFVRGTRVELELDEEQFVGGGALLFASVIEQFLALYCSLNSFSQLSARTRQRKDQLKEWPPRAGQKILL